MVPLAEREGLPRSLWPPSGLTRLRFCGAMWPHPLSWPPSGLTRLRFCGAMWPHPPVVAPLCESEGLTCPLWRRLRE
eukprot:5680398-Prymnesium_polylepis.2